MALYTKIKGPVNYTVVGSPTIENGIASGFSASNYLELPSLNSQGLKKIEFGFCLNNVGDKNYRQYFSMTGLSLCISNGGGVGINYSGSSYYNWNTPPSTGEVLIKSILDIENSQLVISWTADGQTYKTSTHQLSVPISVNSVMYIGKNGTNLIESINLNNSYIKINDAAWFGSSFSKVKVKSGLARYTVVGNPTITNGIASNFSNSNYLTLDTPINLSATDEWELGFKIKTPASNINNKFLTFGTTNCKGILCYVYSTGRIWFTISTSGSSWTYDVDTGYTVTTNTDYWIKYSRKLNTSNNKYYYYIDVSTDGITYNNIYSLQNDSQIYLNNETIFIGTRGNDKSQYWRGTIYLNECYIKINGFYFWKGSKQNILGYKIKTDNLFNGYYFIEDGKLKWANPNIRLIRTGGSNDYILTNYIPNTNTVVKITHGFDSAPEVMNERYTLLWNGGHYNSSTYPDAFYYSWWRASSNTNGYASWFYVGTSGGAQSYSLTMTAGHKYELIVSGSTSVNQKLTDLESGTVLQNYNNTWSFNGSLTKTLRIFSNNTNNTVKYYIYQTKIIENNTVLHQFVPVPKGLIIGDFIVPSNGMFDIIEQKFYENQGTGEFEIGGIPEDYIIEDGKLIWCSDDIYLQNTSSYTAYINTGIIPTNDMRFKVVAQLTDTTNTYDGNLMGSRVGAGNKEFCLWHNTNPGQGGFVYASSWNSGGFGLSNIAGVKNNFIYDGTTFTINGVIPTTSIGNKSTFTSTLPIYLFGLNANGSLESRRFRGKVFLLILWSGNQLLQYLVPVYKDLQIGSFTVPSNGMFDIVNQQFYPNKGTGTFTYGKDE